MVQFGPSRGFGAGFQETFPASFQDALGKFIERKRGEKERISEDIALKEKGFDIEGIRDPRVRQLLLEGQIQQKKSAGDSEKDALRTEAISKYFGPNIGQLYPQLTEGGKTKLTEVALTALSNNMSFEDALMQHVQKNPQDIQDFIPQQSQVPQQNEPIKNISSKSEIKKTEPKEEFSFPEIPLPPMPPKDVRGYKSEIRKANTPVFQEAKEKLRSLKGEESSIKTLNQLNLSKKLPEGIGRIFIDKEGSIKPWAQILSLVPPEAERFVKIINDFTTKAKDSYGARVTNFDLSQFMKRLPTLMNSSEGRAMILKDMEISNKGDQLYHDAIKKIYQHYGLDGISEEKADELAEQMISNQLESLKDQRVNVNEDAKRLVAKSKTPKGRVAVEIDGQIGHVPEEQVEIILKRGGKRL